MAIQSEVEWSRKSLKKHQNWQQKTIKTIIYSLFIINSINNSIPSLVFNIDQSYVEWRQE